MSAAIYLLNMYLFRINETLAVHPNFRLRKDAYFFICFFDQNKMSKNVKVTVIPQGKSENANNVFLKKEIQGEWIKGFFCFHFF